VIARVIAILVVAAGTLTIRRDLVVRAIRAVDRRGGLFTCGAQHAYAAISTVFAGLHRRAAADAASSVGSSPATILDLGSGPGDLLARLRDEAPAATLIGVEPSDDMRTISAARGITTVDGRAEQLPFADSSADLILSTLSAHHWDDAAAAFAEIRRVLRPGGEARIYDVRFAGFGPKEAAALARSAGIDPSSVTHRVLDERLFGLRPYSLITLRP
jgi:ubiquinone/menaquinone biosynthesis C-methylase UbiE